MPSGIVDEIPSVDVIAMKIPEIVGLDRTQAAGLLARAALSVESADLNPSSAPTLPDEIRIRKLIIERLRAEIEHSTSPQEIEAYLIDRLDEEAERIAELADESAALERLSKDAAFSG